MKLLKLVLTVHLNGGGGKDWRFCLLMASILSEIAMKNARKGNNNNNNSDNNNNSNNNSNYNSNNNNNNDKNLAADIPRGCSSCPLFPGWIGIWNISFEEGEKPSEQARKGTENRLNPYVTPDPGIKPGPQWWEASVLTTAPSPFLKEI